MHNVRCRRPACAPSSAHAGARNGVVKLSAIGPFLLTEFGKPFTAAGFGVRFRHWCDAAGLKHCTVHGLRKAQCRRLAEAGCSENEIAAITGHSKLDDIRVYTEAARRKRMAASAMVKLALTEISATKKGTNDQRPDE